MATFLDSLQRADLAAATRRGYRYDLLHFLRWQTMTLGVAGARLDRLSEPDLIAYRQAMIAAGHRPATINRRLDALRRLCRWATQTGALAKDVAREVRPVRTMRNRQPVGLSDQQVHGLLRAAGASSHGLAARNYALVQLMLQTGLRVGEVSALTRGDVVLHDRSGLVRIRHGKGLKQREVPLNATARRALRSYLQDRHGAATGEPLFLSGRRTALPIRSIQAAIAGLARRARLVDPAVSAHTLRHTFALYYLRDNPGKLVELAGLLGHDSLDTTAIYTRPSAADLAADLERSRLNLDRG
jgi:site-specific recombinase XerD